MLENAGATGRDFPAPAPAALALVSLRAAVHAMTTVDSHTLDGREAAVLLHEVRALTSRLEAVAATVVPVVEADGLWALEGWRTFASWLAHTERISVTAAKRHLRLARALRDELPATARAALAGTITMEHAHILTTLAATSAHRRATLAAPDQPNHPDEPNPGVESDAGNTEPGDTEPGDAAEGGAATDRGHEPTERVCNEGFLLEQAAALPVDQFRTVVRRWAAAADPDADDRGYTRAQEREFFELSHTLDGYHVGGFLTVEHGLALQTALDAVMGVPTKDDTRTRSQRRAHAVADLSRLCLDQGLAGQGSSVRPHLSVIVEHATLARLLDTAGTGTAHTGSDTAGTGTAGTGCTTTGPAFPTVPAGTTVVDSSTFRLAEYADGRPIPRTVLATLACDSAINRIIFGPDSAITDAGRTERTYTGTKRRAVIARDRHCRYPGCDAPPALSEVHHRKHWFRDHGPTSVANGILLCWFHHSYIHQHDIEIHRNKTGRWKFTRPDGTIL